MTVSMQLPTYREHQRFERYLVNKSFTPRSIFLWWRHYNCNMHDVRRTCVRLLTRFWRSTPIDSAGLRTPIRHLKSPNVRVSRFILYNQKVYQIIVVETAYCCIEAIAKTSCMVVILPFAMHTNLDYYILAYCF